MCFISLTTLLITLLPKLLRLHYVNIADNSNQTDNDEEYDNEWVVEIVGGSAEAKVIARLQRKLQRKRKADGKSTLSLRRHKRVLWAEQQRVHKRFKRDHNGVTSAAVNDINHNNIIFNDPFWPEQWNLDDGIQHNHTDIVSNYDPQASYDLNDNDPDPMPKFNKMNRHGTRCAGEIAMTPNNSFCGVGIAYNAKIGVDDGKTVEGPGQLTQKAILKGVQQGRDGKSVIYVRASGNGGICKNDDCDCDGYVDSIYTLSVSSVSEDVTSRGMPKNTTTDIENKCTGTFAGTSASAPIAAEIIALSLDANPSLTWRDVQHIVVWTSDPIPLLNINEGWSKNARGLLVNSRFGFGTTTQLLSVRHRDKSSAGFVRWPFMSVHTWGENPRGIWQLNVEDKSMTRKAMTGTISNITLIIYGTKEEPKHYKKESVTERK
ncbi:Neuroendocrine convertase 1 [Dirofilaria immitis]|nr:Neuroendocrine convertase 1 [Dirofilaria immitis]